MVRTYLAAIEGGATGERLAAFYADDVIQEEFPNRLVPLTIPLGNIPAGGQMRARLAMFIEFRGDKIARQRNYDCYDPF
jgi:hypothetical protein